MGVLFFFVEMGRSGPLKRAAFIWVLRIQNRGYEQLGAKPRFRFLVPQPKNKATLLGGFVLCFYYSLFTSASVMMW